MGNHFFKCGQRGNLCMVVIFISPIKNNRKQRNKEDFSFEEIELFLRFLCW